LYFHYGLLNSTLLRLAQSAPCRESQIARHNAGAHKQEESGEARKNTDKDKDKNDREMRHPGIRTRYDHVSGRMRKEGRSAATAAATRPKRSHSLAISEPEYHQPGTIDDADLADHERD